MNQLGRLERALFAVAAVVIAGSLVWQTVSDELSRRQTREFMEMSLEVSRGESIVTSHLVREVPVETVEPLPIPEFVHVGGVGFQPSAPVALLAEGLWFVTVRFTDYEPQAGGPMPTVYIDSVDGLGGAAWSGRSWTHIYVADDMRSMEEMGNQLMAQFTPGDVVVKVTDLPEHVEWWVNFERIGEFKPPER